MLNIYSGIINCKVLEKKYDGGGGGCHMSMKQHKNKDNS